MEKRITVSFVFSVVCTKHLKPTTTVQLLPHGKEDTGHILQHHIVGYTTEKSQSNLLKQTKSKNLRV